MIQLSKLSYLLPLEIVQKCQHCQLCVYYGRNRIGSALRLLQPATITADHTGDRGRTNSHVHHCGLEGSAIGVFPTYFTEFAEFGDKNICHCSKRAQPATSYVSDHNANTAPTRHMFKLNPIQASVIFRFPEFVEFSEISALFRKNSIGAL